MCYNNPIRSDYAHAQILIAFMFISPTQVVSNLETIKAGKL